MNKLEHKLKNIGAKALSVPAKGKIADFPRFCTKQTTGTNCLLLIYFQKNYILFDEQYYANIL
jgi:hypothetical protein